VLKSEEKVTVSRGHTGHCHQDVKHYLAITCGVSGEGLTLAPLNCTVHCLVLKPLALNDTAYVLQVARFNFLMIQHFCTALWVFFTLVIIVLSNRMARYVFIQNVLFPPSFSAGSLKWSWYILEGVLG